jgi:hypothetical protein
MLALMDASTSNHIPARMHEDVGVISGISERGREGKRFGARPCHPSAPTNVAPPARPPDAPSVYLLFAPGVTVMPGTAW